jgi:glutamine synthetase
MTAPSHTAADSLRADLEAKGVRYALASFVDLHGVSKAKAVPLAHLGQMLAGSELFTGAALDGVPQEVSDNEVAAVPDPSTCTVLPWQPELAWFASDLHLQGEPFTACSRNILQRVRAEAASMGYRFNLGIETEFFVLKRDADGRAVPFSDRDNLEKPAYDVRGLLDNLPWLDELVAMG